MSSDDGWEMLVSLNSVNLIGLGSPRRLVKHTFLDASEWVMKA